MLHRILATFLLVGLTLPYSCGDSPKFRSLFNGKDLSGWKGLDGFWKVDKGIIVGETSAENPTRGNTFLVWQDGDVTDFEFRCLVRFTGNNSGVQYRSEVVDDSKFVVAGYQADLHPKQSNFGMLYGEKTGRGIIASRGSRLVIGSDDRKNETAKLDASEEFVDEQWNELKIVAVGNRLIHQINGVTTVDVTDNHSQASQKGVLALQLHAGPPMKVEFRSLLLRKLDATEGKKLIDSLVQATRLASQPKDASSTSTSLRNHITTGDKPKWIWTEQSSNNQRLGFLRSFQVDSAVKQAWIYATCDNRMELFLNGKSLGKSRDWNRPIEKEITDAISQGTNTIVIEGQNEGGVAALAAKLSFQTADGEIHAIVTDKTWQLTANLAKGWPAKVDELSGWSPAVEKGELGISPWGVPRSGNASAQDQQRLNPRNFFAPPGFVVETVHRVEADQGSWVSLATDPQGNLYACDQGSAGLFRLSDIDSEKPTVEKVSVGSLSSLSGAQGLLWDRGGLWFHRNGGNLFRVTDTDGDGKLDTSEKIPSTTGGGEHGNHAVLLSENGNEVYLCSGNHSPMSQTVASRVPTWSEGLLLPRMWDARGHARGILSPGGWVTRLDPETNAQTVHAIGFRNQYDLALNRFNDLFTYDADMEWDLGMPWYRPTRICHVVSGADFGWRSGSGKWPTYYEDSLPPAVEIGPGSPTGVVSGAGSAFPTRYQDSIFALDWTFGTIYAIHLKPDGASYTGAAEPFVFGSPLPVTDAVVGPGGALYFAVGGRGTPSALYRVRYLGDESLDAPSSTDEDAVAARKLRERLESFHGVVDPKALTHAWVYLSHPDRFIRHAARIAVESQPVETWAERVNAETDPQARITASVALARMGDESHQPAMVSALLELNPAELSTGQLLGMLRAYSLTFSELTRPTAAQRQAVIGQLDPLLPHNNSDVNTELIRVLTYLGSESVIPKALNLIENRTPPELPEWSELASRNPGYGRTIQTMLDNHPPTRELGYAFLLRNLRRGWSIDQRRSYFTFLNEAAKAAGGASYPGFLTRIREEALGNCTNEEREALQDITGEDFNPVPDFPISEPKGPGKKWTLQEALSATRGKADFENGRSLFFSAKCASCHRLGGLGGNIGPDLTSVRNKFDTNYLVEAIVQPSKHISDQYGSSRVLTADGSVYVGLVVRSKEGNLTLYPIDENGKSMEIAEDNIELIEPSKVSQMPEGLLDKLNATEVRDLMAYILSAGDRGDRRYRN